MHYFIILFKKLYKTNSGVNPLLTYSGVGDESLFQPDGFADIRFE